jgi:hypothetical protein
MNRIHVCTPLAGLSHFFAVFETSFRIETTDVSEYVRFYSTGTCPMVLCVTRRSVHVSTVAHMYGLLHVTKQEQAMSLIEEHVHASYQV